MKKFIFITMIILVGLINCKRVNEALVAEPEWVDLIKNFSFEARGNPSIEGWKFQSNVLDFPSFSEDTPPEGGDWSVVLSAGDRTYAKLYTVLFPPPGFLIYQFRFWAKSPQKQGYVRLYHNENLLMVLDVNSSDWLLYQQSGRLQIVAGDSIIIEFKTASTATATKLCIDLVKFQFRRKP